jgi:4-amino-4-deoxy-L-arabinose transferase-like glycosyltransferase
MNDTTDLAREAPGPIDSPPPPHSGGDPRDAAAIETETARGLAALAAPRVAIPLLLALGALLFLFNLGGYPLYTKGEPREAVTIYDMVNGGGIVLPMRAGVEIPSKPLLMHWIAALFSVIAGGVSEFTVRLPSALFAIGGVLLCYLYVRRLFGNAIGFLAALIVGTSFQYLQAGTGARVDMTLTFFLEIAFFEFILIAEGMVKRRMFLYVAISLAVLAKGPVGLALPAIVGAMWIATQRRWDLLRDLKLVRGAIIVAIVGGGWYLAAAWVGGAPFVSKQLIAENVVRFLGGAGFHEGHAHPFYYVELSLLAGFMPWTLMLPIPAVQAARNPLRLSPRITYLVLWMAAVLIFYSVARSKRGVYLLALYPALATILAIYLADALIRPGSVRRFTSALAAFGGVALVVTGVAALVGLATLVATPDAMHDFLVFWGIRAPGFTPALSAAIGAHWLVAPLLPVAIEILGFLLVRRPSSLAQLVAVTAAATGCCVLAANLVIVPAIASTLSLRTFTIEMINTVGPHRVAYLDALNYDIAFYSGRTIPIVRMKDPDLPDYLIVWNGIYRHMPPEQQRKFVVAIQSNPTALDGHDAMVLLRRATVAPSPESNATEVRYAPPRRSYDARARRSFDTARTSRGSTSAEPPRRLMSQMRVSSDSYRLTSTITPPRCLTSIAKPAAG